MGYIQQSNDIVTNSSQLLDDIFSSNFNQFLQGLGQPVLVTYWNINDTESTVDNGTETVDENLGANSPNRYNKVENFPLYGAVKEMIPEITVDDNLLDLDLNTEGIILPDTIKPSTHDYFEYKFGENYSRSVIFKINNVNFSTIKSNGYYKIECNMVDIDGQNGYHEKINNQVTKIFDTNLETIGTNDKCVIESKHLKFVRRIHNVIEDLMDQYIDMFYNEKYNSLVYKGLFNGSSFLAYDPWVTNFIIQNGLFTRNRKTPIMLVNFDPETGFRQKYNLTFFHAIEVKSMKYLKDLKYVPVSFSRLNTNPFSYYGEDTTFKLDIYEETPNQYTSNVYMNILFKNNINTNKKSDLLNELESLLVDYFNMDNLSTVLDEEFMNILESFVLTYDEYWFRFTPILIYVLGAVAKDINNSYS